MRDSPTSKPAVTCAASGEVLVKQNARPVDKGTPVDAAVLYPAADAHSRNAP